MTDTLRERVAELFCGGKEPCAACLTDADAAIALCMEEAAKVAEAEAHEECNVAEQIAAAIRALGKP